MDAPADAPRALTRINWLLRQLREAEGDLRVEATFPNARESSSSLLASVREKPDCLLYAADPRRQPRSFTVARTRPMGLKRGKVAGSFVRETRRQVLEFYAGVVQDLKPWQPKPPQLPPQPAAVPSTAQPEPPPFAAIDHRDLGEGVDPEDAPSPAVDGDDWWTRAQPSAESNNAPDDDR
jgi:hypothetical protein